LGDGRARDLAFDPPQDAAEPPDPEHPQHLGQAALVD
jgi:hypothetical protein